MPKTKFFLAAATLLGTTAFVNAATIFPTSPLIQIGDDTDIFFNGSLSFDLKDNLYSVMKEILSRNSVSLFILFLRFSLNASCVDKEPEYLR